MRSSIYLPLALDLMRISRRFRFLSSISSLVIYFALEATPDLPDFEDFGESD